METTTMTNDVIEAARALVGAERITNLRRMASEVGNAAKALARHEGRLLELLAKAEENPKLAAQAWAPPFFVVSAAVSEVRSLSTKMDEHEQAEQAARSQLEGILKVFSASALTFRSK